MKEKKGVRIVIIILLLILFLIGGVLLGQYLSSEKDSNIFGKEVKEKQLSDDIDVDREEDDDEIDEHDYSSIAGEYAFNPESSSQENSDVYKLWLYDNGMFQYQEYSNAEAGYIGNYTIEDDEIKLNSLFSHGSDAALSVDTSITKILKISSEDIIIDNNPKVLSNNSLTKIELKRTDTIISTDDLKNKINNSEIFNKQHTK